MQSSLHHLLLAEAMLVDVSYHDLLPVPISIVHHEHLGGIRIEKGATNEKILTELSLSKVMTHVTL